MALGEIRLRAPRKRIREVGNDELDQFNPEGRRRFQAIYKGLQLLKTAQNVRCVNSGARLPFV